MFMALVLGACNQTGDPAPQTSETAELPSPVPSAASSEPRKSIIRPDLEATPIAAIELKPIELSVTFDDKSAQPDKAALAELDRIMTTPSFQAGGPIILRGHSDSLGSDKKNLAASKKRAEAVRDYLEKKGVSADRMTVVALGEGRPIAPNRKLDGSDDPEGRAKNRRVEILVELPSSTADELDPAANEDPAPKR
jgi:Outer membrane protein and related peptidoglycan-associated (lipo)proteins